MVLTKLFESLVMIKYKKFENFKNLIAELFEEFRKAENNKFKNESFESFTLDIIKKLFFCNLNRCSKYNIYQKGSNIPVIESEKIFLLDLSKIILTTIFMFIRTQISNTEYKKYADYILSKIRLNECVKNSNLDNECGIFIFTYNRIM